MHKYHEYPNHSINNSTPENAFIEVEDTNKIFDLIKGWLKDSQYQAMALRYRTDHSIKEVAEKISENGFDEKDFSGNYCK